MRIFYKTKLLFIFFLTVLCLNGCQTFPDMSKEKNGARYGTTRGLFQGRWWHFYERGISFADGQFWKEADSDLREAIRQRNNDQRRARTYGLLNFTDYFPHRELGIILYRQGYTKESIKELTASLATEKSAKAEFYLDMARKKLIEKEQSDQEHPEITVISPKEPVLTNAFSVAVRGIARDDTFVRHIKVGKQDIRVDVSNREIPFFTEIPRHREKAE
ncbi:MAG: hypothetical protein GY795_23715 [Desulfobacterales bacterium]|nr:hypothetical protein [Desulfobacterales bacterium]